MLCTSHEVYGFCAKAQYAKRGEQDQNGSNHTLTHYYLPTSPHKWCPNATKVALLALSYLFAHVPLMSPHIAARDGHTFTTPCHLYNLPLIRDTAT